MGGKTQHGNGVPLRRSKRLSTTDSTAYLRFKLLNLTSRHHKLKIAFQQLHSQIHAGLLEAEDVFASLAMPLMQLVGMKTAQMAEEGRITAIINVNSVSNYQESWRNESAAGIKTDLSSSGVGADEKQTDDTLKEDNFANKVNMAGKELVRQQKLQLLQLVDTLKQIKSEVTLSQDHILQTLAYRKESLQKFFQKVVNYVQAIHQSREDNGNFLFTVQVLKAVFNNVGVTLSSVEDGVEELINNVAEKMYNPMVKYVHGLKEEMETGTCPRLLSVVAEMERKMKVGRLQLEECKLKVKELEKFRPQSLRLLKGSEEGLMKTKYHAGMTQEMVFGTPLDGKAEDKLLWEMLRNKRKYQLTSSPQGPHDLLGIGSSNKQLKSTNLSTKRVSHRPHQSMISRVPLGSSPSATAH